MVLGSLPWTVETRVFHGMHEYGADLGFLPTERRRGGVEGCQALWVWIQPTFETFFFSFLFFSEAGFLCVAGV